MVAGCEKKWEAFHDQTPWVGPDARVKSERRTRELIAEHYNYEYRWIAPDGQILDPFEVRLEAGSFLLRTAAGQKLDPQKPPWITIVSIKPTVALIVPTNLAQVPLGDLLGERMGDLPMTRDPGGLRADYGISTFYNPGIRWFSPELNQEPTDLVFSSEGIAVIPLPDGKLVIEHIDQICKIARK
jgi:hypothetical protein